jgi:protein-L-isoaspartate(D-aspartate) O-methyltransferase
MQELDRSVALRTFFARYVAAKGRARDPRIEQAFAAVERQRFAGPGPWSINIPGVGYIRTPSDDPAFIYQDTLVAIDPERGINIGQPSSHAHWLDALGLCQGETVIQVGAGTGYYTTVLAHLVGPTGYVHAYEIDQVLAARAEQNLAHMPWVTVYGHTGIADDLPKADAIYVNAGTTQPSWCWIDAMKGHGRLLFPLHAEGAVGGMLLIRKPEYGAIWPARFVSGAAFVSLVGGQSAEASRGLNAAFERGGKESVQSFRIGEAIDDTCWFAGVGWWLSTSGSASVP